MVCLLIGVSRAIVDRSETFPVNGRRLEHAIRRRYGLRLRRRPHGRQLVLGQAELVEERDVR